MPVYRIFVEKRPEYAVEAKGVLSDLKTALRPEGLEGLRILNRYDVEGISEEVFVSARATVFSEPQVDVTADKRASFCDRISSGAIRSARRFLRSVHSASDTGRAPDGQIDSCFFTWR
jgi:hypothetical protein